MKENDFVYRKTQLHWTESYASSETWNEYLSDKSKLNAITTSLSRKKKTSRKRKKITENIAQLKN